MTCAIIKPDHLGDLVLSSPAIRAIAAAQPGTVLFVATKTLALARHLFPDLEIRTIDFAHLLKSGGVDRIPDLSSFHTVAFLRNDAVITENWAALRARRFLMPRDTHDLHQSMIDYSVASLLAGPYDIDAAFYGDREQRVAAKAVGTPRRVGLSIGSGFHTNSWPVAKWLETARMLLGRADRLTILCGPAERDKAVHILEKLDRPSVVEIVAGGQDIAEFVARVDELDLVVATDGGTAHLCSLVTPVVSVFGSSPFRRYAPFGRLNRLLTRQLPCSPCCQYATELVNGCLTIECMTWITARHLERALALPLRADTRSQHLPPADGVHLFVGVSHAHREHRLARYHRDARRLAAEHPNLVRWVEPASTDLLHGVQEARIGLVNAVDRLKHASPAQYGAGIRRIALRFAELRAANIAAGNAMLEQAIGNQESVGGSQRSGQARSTRPASR